MHDARVKDDTWRITWTSGPFSQSRRVICNSIKTAGIADTLESANPPVRRQTVAHGEHADVGPERSVRHDVAG